MHWRALKDWPLEGQRRAAHQGDRNNRGSLSAGQVPGGAKALCAFPPNVWSKEGICVVLRQTRAAGSMRWTQSQCQALCWCILKGCSWILKGGMFVKLYHGLRRSSVEETPKNTLEKCRTFLPVTARDGSTSVPSCSVVLLKSSSSFLHPAVSHGLPYTASEVSQTLCTWLWPLIEEVSSAK